MSGVSQIQIFSKSRKARDPSGFAHHHHWSPPSFPNSHFFHAYEPPPIPVTAPVTILPRSSSLPPSFFHHAATAATAAAAANGSSKDPGAAHSNFPGAPKHDRAKTFQRRQCSRKIHTAAADGLVSGEEQHQDSVEVTIVQANGNKETKKLVTGSNKNVVSTSKQHDKVPVSGPGSGSGSYRKKHVAPSSSIDFRRSGSEPIDARNRGARRTKSPELEDEKWAGPAYSKSPPPSSLPLPKFSVDMRSLSIDSAIDATGSSSSSSNISSSSSSSGNISSSSSISSSNISSSSSNISSSSSSSGNISSSSGSSSISSGGNSVGSSTPEDVAGAANRLTSPSPCNCWDAAFATEDLKRILNLDQQVTS